MFHFKSWLMVTPSNLALVTNSRGLPFRTRGSKSWLQLENPIRSSLHLASFRSDLFIISLLFVYVFLECFGYFGKNESFSPEEEIEQHALVYALENKKICFSPGESANLASQAKV